MSVSDIALFRKNFEAVCFETVAYEDLRAALARPDVAAVIVEPQVQAAAGMRLVPDEVHELLKGPLDALLIVDEIATGFGRTGTMFAFQALGIAPDLLCVGKGITGGGLALSAVLVTDRVFDAFTSEYTSDYRHLFHGHSYAANPIACAAALASLDLFESEGTLDAAGALATHLARRLASLRTHAGVTATRQAGLMCGIELASLASEEDAKVSRGWRVANAMYDRGHFTRPIGNVVQLVPPLSTTPSEIDAFFDVLAEVVS
jgi:adenosylmethionine-8-amino-7-oxononanoate aminotransferase